MYKKQKLESEKTLRRYVQIPLVELCHQQYLVHGDSEEQWAIVRDVPVFEKRLLLVLASDGQNFRLRESRSY